MNHPADRMYTESHEWVALDGETATVGLTEYAQSELGDLVFVNLPEPGDEVSGGESFADVESVKAVSEVISPVDGTVTEINDFLRIGLRRLAHPRRARNDSRRYDGRPRLRRALLEIAHATAAQRGLRSHAVRFRRRLTRCASKQEFRKGSPYGKLPPVNLDRARADARRPRLRID